MESAFDLLDNIWHVLNLQQRVLVHLLEQGEVVRAFEGSVLLGKPKFITLDLLRA